MVKTAFLGALKTFGVLERADHSGGSVLTNTQLRRHKDLIDFIQRVGIKKTDRILDVGCGTGALAQRLQEAGFESVDGVDWLPIEKLVHANAFRKYVQVDLNNDCLPSDFNNQYDLVISSDVIEHLEAPARFFRIVKPIMKNSGSLVVTIPNAFNIFQRICLLLTGNSSRYRTEKANQYGHISLITSQILTSLLNRTELFLVDCAGGGIFLSNFCLFPNKNFGSWLSYYLIYHIKNKA